MSIRSLNILTGSPALLPCWKCGQEAIAYSYTAEGPGLRWLYAVKCRYSDCQKVEDCATETGATDNWNAIQAGAADHSEQPRNMVNHPPHYNGHPSGVECIEVAEHLPFCLGNAFKYLFRRNDKGSPRQDLEKALWYIRREQAARVPGSGLYLISDDAALPLAQIVASEPAPYCHIMEMVGSGRMLDLAESLLRDQIAGMPN